MYQTTDSLIHKKRYSPLAPLLLTPRRLIPRRLLLFQSQHSLEGGGGIIAHDLCVCVMGIRAAAADDVRTMMGWMLQVGRLQ